MKSKNPKCRMCGKTLPKIWYGTDWATDHFKSEPLEVRTAKYDPKEVQGFYGHYGKDGKGNFCTYRCAFQWANYQLRQNDRT